MPSSSSQKNSGATRRPTAPVCSQKPKSTPRFPTKQQRPADQTEPGHAARDEPGRVHEVAQEQPVPEGNDESGAEQSRPVLQRSQGHGEVDRLRRILTQADEAEHEDDPRRDEDALDDPRRDVADGEDLALPPSDRVEHDRSSDVRDDEKELQEGTQADLAVPPITGEVTGRIVENGLEKKRSRDRREKRDDEQHPEDPGGPLIVGHPIPLRAVECCLGSCCLEFPWLWVD